MHCGSVLDFHSAKHSHPTNVQSLGGRGCVGLHMLRLVVVAAEYAHSLHHDLPVQGYANFAAPKNGIRLDVSVIPGHLGSCQVHLISTKHREEPGASEILCIHIAFATAEDIEGIEVSFVGTYSRSAARLTRNRMRDHHEPDDNDEQRPRLAPRNVGDPQAVGLQNDASSNQAPAEYHLPPVFAGKELDQAYDDQHYGPEVRDKVVRKYSELVQQQDRTNGDNHQPGNHRPAATLLTGTHEKSPWIFGRVYRTTTPPPDGSTTESDLPGSTAWASHAPAPSRKGH